MTPQSVKAQRLAAEAALRVEKADAQAVIRRLLETFEAARDETDAKEAQRLRFNLQGAMIAAVDLDCAFVAGWPKRLIYGITHHIGVWRDLITVPPFVRAELDVLLEGQIQLARKVFELEGA